MASSTSPVAPIADVQFAPIWRVDFAAQPAPKAAPSLAAKAVEAQAAEQQAQAINQLLPGELLIEVDRASGRFVHTLKDASTEEVKWRFPSEAQLAFSRAVNAYNRAVFGG